MSIARNTVIKARINDEVKYHAEQILNRLGLTKSEAINMFFNQIVLTNGVPFDIKIPNELTRKTLEESAQGKNVVRFQSSQELFDDLGI